MVPERLAGEGLSCRVHAVVLLQHLRDRSSRRCGWYAGGRHPWASVVRGCPQHFMSPLLSCYSKRQHGLHVTQPRGRREQNPHRSIITAASPPSNPARLRNCMALSTNAPFRRVADPVTLTKALVSSQPRFGRGFLIAIRIGQDDQLEVGSPERRQVLFVSRSLPDRLINLGGPCRAAATSVISSGSARRSGRSYSGPSPPGGPEI